MVMKCFVVKTMSMGNVSCGDLVPQMHCLLMCPHWDVARMLVEVADHPRPPPIGLGRSLAVLLRNVSYNYDTGGEDNKSSGCSGILIQQAMW